MKIGGGPTFVSLRWTTCCSTCLPVWDAASEEELPETLRSHITTGDDWGGLAVQVNSEVILTRLDESLQAQGVILAPLAGGDKHAPGACAAPPRTNSDTGGRQIPCTAWCLPFGGNILLRTARYYGRTPSPGANLDEC